jgi:hypothetical protein
MPVDEVEAIITVRPQNTEVVIAVPGPAGTGGGGSASMTLVSPGWIPSYSETYVAGEQYFETDGTLWICIVSGSPGSWYKISGFTAWNAIVIPSPDTIPADTLFPIAFIPGP